MGLIKEWTPDPHCVGCMYLAGKSGPTCDYILIEGHPRPCSAEEVRAGRCTVRKAAAREGRKKGFSLR